MPSPVDLFSSYNNRRSTSGLIVETIIDNFEYFISFAGKDFKQVLGRKKITRDIEDIWSFFARHSVKSSPSYPYLMEFITNNIETIQNSTIISFLNRTSPRSPILKDILLRIINSDNAKNKSFAGKILGTNFNDDKQVFENVIKVKDNFDVGRIIALCNGWPEQEVLRKIFDEIVLRQSNIDHYVGFNLKFLFRNIDNLATFLKQVLASPKESRRFHQYYFVPMIERISRDPQFCLSIKRSLLASVSVNEKISYYNLLSQVNMIDYEVRVWKSQVKDFTNDYGYDIVTNKEVRLKNILYDYYYHLN